MQIEVIKIGKPAFDAYEPLVAEYQKRLGPFCKIKNSILKESEAAKKLRSRDSAQRHYTVVLDEGGVELSSIGLSKKVQRWLDDPAINHLKIVIGPPYGFKDNLAIEPSEALALSKLTMTSDMAWLLVWEQLYRSYQIIQGTGYHHE